MGLTCVHYFSTMNNNNNTPARLPLPTFTFRRAAVRAVREACEAYANEPTPMNKARMFMAAETLEAIDSELN